MKDKIISDLNALFKARAEFYGFFDTHIPKVGQTAVFDFAKLHSNAGDKGCANEKVSLNGENLACSKSGANFKGENLGENLAQGVDLEQIYKLFYHYDYAIRKLLPSVYKAYKIDTEKDLSKDF